METRECSRGRSLAGWKLVAVVVTVLALKASAVQAKTAVVEISQKRALAGKVTPGDTKGFPVTISQPGSYRLISNLVVDGFGPAIDIEAGSVTLDLNGFSIIGMGNPPGNSSYPCVTAGTETLIVIRNGIIQNCPFGIQFPNVSDATIEQIQIQTSSNTSLAVAANAIVRGNHLHGPNSSIYCPSIVVDTTFVGSAGNNGIPTATCAKTNVIGNF